MLASAMQRCALWWTSRPGNGSTRAAACPGPGRLPTQRFTRIGWHPWLCSRYGPLSRRVAGKSLECLGGGFGGLDQHHALDAVGKQCGITGAEQIALGDAQEADALLSQLQAYELHVPGRLFVGRSVRGLSSMTS